MFYREIDISDHQRTVLSLLRRLMPLAPAGYLQQLLKGEGVRLDGEAASAEQRLRLGQRLALKESKRTSGFLAGTADAVDILWEDQRLLVANKPPGLPMHRAAEVDSHNLVELAIAQLEQRGTPAHLRPVNRLDRGTSGVVLLAKSAVAAGMFGRLVQEEGLAKLYLAIVDGTPPDQGSIERPIDDKLALTRYRTLTAGKGAALVALWPVTGRLHQLRRHLAAIGHPVRGDRRYGSRTLPGYPGFFLHAYRLSLPHPEQPQPLDLLAPLPAGFAAACPQLAVTELPGLLDALPAVYPG